MKAQIPAKNVLNSPGGGTGEAERLPAVGRPGAIRFLVAHENVSVRALLRDSLKGLGFHEVLELVPAAKALEALSEDGVDVLIAGSEIPEMKGWSLLRSIRKDPKLSKTKVLVVTGDGGKETIRDAVQAGADDCIVLPVSEATLEKKVRALFPGNEAAN